MKQRPTKRWVLLNVYTLAPIFGLHFQSKNLFQNLKITLCVTPMVIATLAYVWQPSSGPTALQTSNSVKWVRWDIAHIKTKHLLNVCHFFPLSYIELKAKPHSLLLKNHFRYQIKNLHTTKFENDKNLLFCPSSSILFLKKFFLALFYTKLTIS